MDHAHVILSNTYTVPDLRRRIALLRELVGRLVYTKQSGDGESILGSLTTFCKERGVPSDHEQAFIEWGTDLFESIISQPDPYGHLASVESEAEKAPTLFLVSPVDLPQSDVRDIGLWARENVDARVLVGVRVDASLVAGCAFSWKGRYYDIGYAHRRQESREKVFNKVRERVSA